MGAGVDGGTAGSRRAGRGTNCPPCSPWRAGAWAAWRFRWAPSRGGWPTSRWTALPAGGGVGSVTMDTGVVEPGSFTIGVDASKDTIRWSLTVTQPESGTPGPGCRHPRPRLPLLAAGTAGRPVDLPCTADGPRGAHAPGAGARQPAEERREAHDTTGAERRGRRPHAPLRHSARPGAPSPRPRSPVSAHQGSGPSLSVKVPVGPSGPTVAIRTTISAPSSPLRVPALPWRSVLVKPEAPLARPGRGLRREEPAMLVGVSVDYVIRLEQGRATRSSGQVIEALARVLRLNPDERAHLVPPGRTRPARPGHGARPPHTERAAAAGPPRRHPGRRPGRGDDLARRELRVRGSDGDPSMLRGLSRNRLRHHFLGPPGRVRRT